jgi:hypothetical protein
LICSSTRYSYGTQAGTNILRQPAGRPLKRVHHSSQCTQRVSRESAEKHVSGSRIHQLHAAQHHNSYHPDREKNPKLIGNPREGNRLSKHRVPINVSCDATLQVEPEHKKCLHPALSLCMDQVQRTARCAHFTSEHRSFFGPSKGPRTQATSLWSSFGWNSHSPSW